MFRYGLIVALLLCSNLIADDDGFDDEFDDGFEVTQEIIEVDNLSPKAYSIYGNISFDTSYNYAHKKPINNTLNDFRYFSSAKTSADIYAEYKFENSYKLKANIKAYKDFIYTLKEDEYKTIPKDYEDYSDINELYLQGSINSNLDFRIGRQIVVWGKSDNIRITDTLNPLNNLTPAMTDIEDLRLGRTMAKFDYYTNGWDISTIFLLENRYSMMPKYGSDFAPQNKILANSLSVDEPSNSLKNSGFALSLSKNYEGQDIAFYLSNQFVDNTTYKTNMLGFAYNKVIDSFLLKSEIAYFDNYDSSVVDSKTDALIGVEYNAIDDGSISFEIANKDKTIQYALRFNQSYFNDTLDFTTLVDLFGKDTNDGGFTRIWIDYDYNDDIQLSLGVVDYIGGDNIKFDMLKDNDRVFGSMQYSF